MTRYFAHIILLLLLGLAAALFFIRVQPYNDNDVRAMLLPAGCPSPCFLGIRPGGTSVDEAMRLLKQDKRVEQVTSHFDPYFDRPVVNWSWRNAAGSDPNGFVYLLDEKHPVVEAMQANPGIAMGYINLVLGKPTCSATAVYPFDQNQMYFVLVYREHLMVASAVFDARYHFDYRMPGHLEIISQTTRNRIGYPDSLCQRQTGG